MQLKDYNEEHFEKFLTLLREGAPVSTALDVMQIPRTNYYYWLRQAATSDNPIYKQLETRVKQAKADFITSCVKDVKVGGRKQWQASAWLLERKMPEEYSEKFRLKKYPEHLAELPFEKQGNEIFRMLLNGEISQHEAHMFVQILAEKAKVEENFELKRQLFEIKQKMK